MSLLTDQEIDALWTDEPNVPQKVKRRELVRIAQAATITKLAGVSLEPVAHITNPNGDDDYDSIPVYTATQLAAARVQGIEDAEKSCLERHANGNFKHDTREECAEAIRALIGGSN